MDLSPIGESVSSPTLFIDVCALTDLSDLATESDCNIIEDNTGHNPVSFKIKSDFYPISSRGKDMDLYEKIVERDLSNLAKNICNHGSDNLSVDEKLSVDELHKLFHSY